MKMIIKHFKDASQKNLTRDTEMQKKFWWYHQSKKTVQKKQTSRAVNHTKY